MKLDKIVISSLIGIFALAPATFVPLKASASTVRGQDLPAWVVQTYGSNAAGSDNTYKVVLTGTPSVDQVVDITASQSGAYTNLPSTVTVRAGTDNVSFTARVSNNPPSQWTLTASCNGGSASLGVLTPPPAR